MRVLLNYCTTSRSIRPERIKRSCLAGLNEEKKIVSAFLLAPKDTNGSAKPSINLVIITLGNTRETSEGMSRTISL